MGSLVKDSGRMGLCMVKESAFILMEAVIKGNSRVARGMDMGSLRSRMVLFTQVSGKKENAMDKVRSPKSTGKLSLDCGGRTNDME